MIGFLCDCFSKSSVVSLLDLNKYKRRVDELNAPFKKLDHQYSTLTEAMQDHNETFKYFEGRILRLDEVCSQIWLKCFDFFNKTVNNMVRKSRGIFTKVLFFLLSTLFSVIGALVGYGISVVYFFRRKTKEEKGRSLIL